VALDLLIATQPWRYRHRHWLGTAACEDQHQHHHPHTGVHGSAGGSMGVQVLSDGGTGSQMLDGGTTGCQNSGSIQNAWRAKACPANAPLMGSSPR
jgi:hypothetical protein